MAPESKPAAPTTAPAKPAESKTGAATPATGAATPAAAAKTTPAAAGTSGQAAPATKGVTIEIATRGGSDGEIMEKSIVTFAQETGIQAKHVAYGGEPEYWAKVQSLYATKQVADVIWASLGNLHNFANRGVLAELEPLIKADNYDLGDYVPNALKSCSLNGKLYAMPWGGHPGNSGLLYNLDLLEQAGLKAPDASWTLETLADAARKLTKESGGRVEQFGFSAGTDFLSLNNFIGGFGGEFFMPPEAGKTLTIDEDKFKQGLNYVRDFFVTIKSSPTPGPDLDTANLFASGKIALLHSGYGGQFSPGEKAIAGKFKWGEDLIPKGPIGKAGSSLTINGQTISSISTKQDAAWQFLKWLMEPKNHIPIVLAGGSRPALRNSVLDAPELNEKLPAHKRFAEAIKASDPWKEPANYRWPEFSTTVSQVFADLWTGGKTVDQALPDAKTKLQAILDKAAID
jgi:multiple sugar transport system substrate-binding protein